VRKETRWCVFDAVLSSWLATQQNEAGDPNYCSEFKYLSWTRKFDEATLFKTEEKALYGVRCAATYDKPRTPDRFQVQKVVAMWIISARMMYNGPDVHDDK
jgi:hypothetical protein